MSERPSRRDDRTESLAGRATTRRFTAPAYPYIHCRNRRTGDQLTGDNPPRRVHVPSVSVPDQMSEPCGRRTTDLRGRAVGRHDRTTETPPPDR
ncbi:hypothetical protein D7147_17485 [Micromonospora musae]|uniref:Uncharacterized protein n=1 Tax=Micromonospora musae TaxID=1894970 RepID=A0ABX9R3M3_9ACTN|nr:hypothetical protein D7147_17485 [Micromonospora musae]